MREPEPAGNLPLELDTFVGRSDELLDVRRLLAVARTVTRTGAGGIGKSRLALRAARQLERHFPDGVWWVELAEVDDAALVVDAVARVVGASEQPAVPIADALADFLRERRLLLVLDNCEHLVVACQQLVTAIVSRGEAPRVLCTSRQRLGVPGEMIVVVSPLGLPEPSEPLKVAALDEVEAVGLLVERARAVAPDFALTEENCAAASEVCRRLDGLPLAIELAAVRLASLTPEDLLARLDDRFRLLRTERQHHSRRQQALRATVDWSYELLSEEEQILWRRLCVFAGSFGIAAAEAVCPGDGLEQERIVDLVASLVERSIVTMRQGGRSSRYRLLETMRLYGAERLREAGEELEIQRRHARWYAEMISGGVRPWWLPGSNVDVIDALDLEWANVESVLERCARDSLDVPMGLRMATDLWTYWSVRGRFFLGLRHLKELVALAPRSDPARVMGLFALGWLSQAVGDEVAIEALEEARRCSEPAGDDRAWAYAVMGIGTVRLRQGGLTEAAALLALALPAMDRSDDPTGRALVRNYLATILSIAEKPGEAIGLAREGLELSEPAGDTMLRSLLGTLVGILEWQLGDHERAEERLSDAVRIRDRLDWVWGLVISVDALAWVAGASGRPERSARLLGVVTSLWRQLGIPAVPYLQGHHRKCVASVRAGLGEARYQACFEQGIALDRRQLVALTLDDVLPTVTSAAVSAARDPFELTARELEVARLVAEGLSNPAIASRLYVSVATVKTHVSHILQKLALGSRVQLASWAAAHRGPSRPAPGSCPGPRSSSKSASWPTPAHARARMIDLAAPHHAEGGTMTSTAAGGRGTDLRALRARIAGRVIARDDASWTDARRAGGLAVGERPVAVVVAECVEDVMAVVRFARTRGLRIAAHRRCHRPCCSPLDDVVVLTTARLRGVEIDASGWRVRIEAGALERDVAWPAAQHGLVGLLGSLPDAGVVDHALGGGIGWLSRRHGLAADSVTAVEMVTADGALAWADEETEPELFWAVRGGEGCFGVVTAIEVELFDVPKLFTATMCWPIGRAGEVVRAWRTCIDATSDDVMSVARIVPDPSPAPTGGVVVIDTIFTGPEPEDRELLAALRTLRPSTETFAAVSPTALPDLLGSGRSSVSTMGGGIFLERLPVEALDAIVEAAVPPLRAVEVVQLGGELARPSSRHGAIGPIDAKVVLFATGGTATPERRSVVADQIERATESLAPWASARTYVNLFDAPIGSAQRFPAATRDRLRRVRSLYDPGELFVADQYPSGR